MEIITGVERRRRWRLEEKLRIVAETEQAGACFAEIARRYDVSRGLLWNWRSQARRGVLAPRLRRRSCRCTWSAMRVAAPCGQPLKCRDPGTSNSLPTAGSRSA